MQYEVSFSNWDMTTTVHICYSYTFLQQIVQAPHKHAHCYTRSDTHKQTYSMVAMVNTIQHTTLSHTHTHNTIMHTSTCAETLVHLSGFLSHCKWPQNPDQFVDVISKQIHKQTDNETHLCWKLKIHLFASESMYRLHLAVNIHKYNHL